MNSGRSVGAVHASRHREEQPGHHDVRELQAHVILAATEYGHLDQTRQLVAATLVLHREDRMRNLGILSMNSAVAQEQARVSLPVEEMVEVSSHVLNGERVGGPRFERFGRGC